MFPNTALVDYFRCPAEPRPAGDARTVVAKPGTSRSAARCATDAWQTSPAAHVDSELVDAFDAPKCTVSGVAFRSTWRKCHQPSPRALSPERPCCPRSADVREHGQRVYYFLRPMLRVGVRKTSAKDSTERLGAHRVSELACRRQRRLADAPGPGSCLKQTGVDRLPFVWFWPDGADSAPIMTHDVEGPAGRSSATG